jgi:hypothetical protein
MYEMNDVYWLISKRPSKSEVRVPGGDQKQLRDLIAGGIAKQLPLHTRVGGLDLHLYTDCSDHEVDTVSGSQVYLPHKAQTSLYEHSLDGILQGNLIVKRESGSEEYVGDLRGGHRGCLKFGKLAA